MPRLTVLKAAEYVGLAASTLNMMRTDGKGPKFAKLGRRVVYDTKDLDTWLERNKRSSTSDKPELRRRRRRSRNTLDLIR